MNRLVIIGNGFDLAHGLPTSYKDFIDDFWKNFNDKCKSEDYQKLIFTDDRYNDYYLGYKLIENLNDFMSNIKEYSKDCGYEFDEINLVCYTSKFGNREKIFGVKSHFFKLINIKHIENWVDIENEYYKLLKQCIKQEDNLSIIKLNNEFEDLKKLFEQYLIEKVEEEYGFSKEIVEEFIKIFSVKKYEGHELSKFYSELTKKDEISIRNENNEIREEKLKINYNEYRNYKENVIVQTFFLSFNYTSTVFNYIKALDMSLYNLNEIHGRLEDERNLINFGFGDEMDKHYQEIEEKDDNEYLRNIKSFQYLHTPNYKRLLDLVDSEKFQVYIMGHSCGLSDRTLLNTIFEHENCCSIKVFYHEILNEEGEVVKDNYTEITQNISRHFNKKTLMREKIVNKTLCQALPQIQLPRYEEKTASISESRL